LIHLKVDLKRKLKEKKLEKLDIETAIQKNEISYFDNGQQIVWEE
jgi:hypothetical protein